MMFSQPIEEAAALASSTKIWLPVYKSAARRASAMKDCTGLKVNMRRVSVIRSILEFSNPCLGILYPEMFLLAHSHERLSQVWMVADITASGNCYQPKRPASIKENFVEA